MGWFDVHAHLTDPRLAAREAEVLDHARAAGLSTVISNGLNPEDNARVAALAARAPDLVRPAFGLYPVDAVAEEMAAAGEPPGRRPPVPAEVGVRWVRDHVDQCVAVGEIGLDHHWVPEALWPRQEAIFRELVQLAIDADKPIILHSRKAEPRAFEILVEMGARRVNWHCYSAKVKLGLRIAAHGHWLSIPAHAHRAQNFRKLLAELPRDKVLLETDCPYLGPDRGVLNEPANVVRTAELAAELWGTGLDAVQRQLAGNFEALFGFAP